MLTPLITDVSLTPTGCRTLTARYPLAMAMHACHLPPLVHDGVHYVPYTGTVVDTQDREEKHQKARGFYMEYRALREEK